MPSQPTSPKSTNQDRVDYYGIWGLVPDKHHLISATTYYAVWLDELGELDWETTEEFDREIERKSALASISELLNRAAILQAYPVEHLSDIQRKNFRIMIGEGLARGFDFEQKSAIQMLDKAAEYGTARNQEIARLWYLSGAFFTTMFFMLVLLLAVWNLDNGVKLFGENVYYVGLGSCVGGFGALFSILLRAGKVPLDPSAGRLLHNLEGGGRIIIGFFSAAVIQVAAHIGIAFTIFSQKGRAGVFIIAFAAGFSEQLAHTIIKKVEMNSAPKNTHNI